MEQRNESRPWADFTANYQTTQPVSIQLLDKNLTCDRLQATLWCVIKSFRHRGLKRLYERDDKSQVRADMLDRIENILALLDRANRPEVMDLPGFRLHPLKGDMRGFWAVTVRANWRIVWRFEGTDAVDVDLIDYH